MGIKTQDTLNINNATTNPDYIGRTNLAPENGTLASPTIPNELEVTDRFADVNSSTFDISPLLEDYSFTLFEGWNLLSYTVPYSFHLPAMLLSFFEPQLFNNEASLSSLFPNGIGVGVNSGFSPFGVALANELLSEKMEIIKDYDGNAYAPGNNFNGIGDAIPGEGYDILMKEEVTGRFKTLGISNVGITNFSQYLAFQNELKFNLPAGWSIIGYNRITQKNMVEALAEIVDDLIVIKDRNGFVYYPFQNFNGIGDITPGVGYAIKMENAVNNFTFPPDDLPQNIDLPFANRIDEPNVL